MFLLNQLTGSLQIELDRFFRVLGLADWLQRYVTAAALSKARKKLKYTAFIELNDKALSIFYADFPDQERWQGMRLLAVDGSRVELPRDHETEAKFGVHETSGHPMGLLSTLCDVNHRLWLHAELLPLNTPEREAAKLHLDKTTPDDLLLYDRGYPSFWFFALHQQAGRHFCMRLQRKLFPCTDAFFDAEEAERIVHIQPTKARRRQCHQHGASVSPISLRLVRVVLDSGVVEVLATSLLDAGRFPADLFAGLYRKRWGHEECYKQLKIHAELQNWSGKQLDTLLQDLYAKMLTLNLASMQQLAAQRELDKKELKRRSQVNRFQALARMKDTIIKILTDANPHAWIRRLTAAMTRQSNAVRTDRRFSRKLRPGTSVRVRPAYKTGR